MPQKRFEANSRSELKMLLSGQKHESLALSDLRLPQATSSGIKKVLKWSLMACRWLKYLILALHTKYEPFRHLRTPSNRLLKNKMASKSATNFF